MSASFLRKPWAWVLIAVAALLILFTLLPGGSDNIERPLTEFIEEVRAGNVQRVEVDDSVLEYKLVGVERTFETRMEEDDTLRQVLQDSGIAPGDFPLITIKEAGFLSRIPGLIFTFLPIIVITGVLYFFIQRARAGGVSKTRDIDPVCGKRVGAEDAIGSSTFQDISYRFCSAQCKQRFDAAPVSYLLKT